MSKSLLRTVALWIGALAIFGTAYSQDTPMVMGESSWDPLPYKVILTDNQIFELVSESFTYGVKISAPDEKGMVSFARCPLLNSEGAKVYDGDLIQTRLSECPITTPSNIDSGGIILMHNQESKSWFASGYENLPEETMAEFKVFLSDPSYGNSGSGGIEAIPDDVMKRALAEKSSVVHLGDWRNLSIENLPYNRLGIVPIEDAGLTTFLVMPRT